MRRIWNKRINNVINTLFSLTVPRPLFGEIEFDKFLNFQLKIANFRMHSLSTPSHDRYLRSQKNKNKNGLTKTVEENKRDTVVTAVNGNAHQRVLPNRLREKKTGWNEIRCRIIQIEQHMDGDFHAYIGPSIHYYYFSSLFFCTHGSMFARAFFSCVWCVFSLSSSISLFIIVIFDGSAGNNGV